MYMCTITVQVCIFRYPYSSYHTTKWMTIHATHVHTRTTCTSAGCTKRCNCRVLTRSQLWYRHISAECLFYWLKMAFHSFPMINICNAVSSNRNSFLFFCWRLHELWCANVSLRGQYVRDVKWLFPPMGHWKPSADRHLEGYQVIGIFRGTSWWGATNLDFVGLIEVLDLQIEWRQQP